MSAPDPAALVQEAIDCLAALMRHIRFETEHVRAGKLREGLAAQEQKAAAAARYARCLAAMPEAGGLSQEARAAASELTRMHEAFQQMLAANLAVLATARSVSESILREASQQLGATGPKLYGPAARRDAGAPLALSRST